MLAEAVMVSRLRRKVLRRVEPAGRDGIPIFAGLDVRIEFPFPEDLKQLAFASSSTQDSLTRLESPERTGLIVSSTR